MRGRIARIGIVLGIVLATAPVAPAAAGGGCHATEVTTAATRSVVMRAACFLPTLARVPVGSTVGFVNEDPLKHTVTGAGLAWGNLEEMGQGQTLEAAFPKAGVYPYYCFLHAGMVGAIIVGDDAQLSTALGRTIGGDAVNVSSVGAKTPVKVATQKTASNGSSWPALATGIGLGGVVIGVWVSRVLNSAARRESSSVS